MYDFLLGLSDNPIIIKLEYIIAFILIWGIPLIPLIAVIWFFIFIFKRANSYYKKKNELLDYQLNEIKNKDRQE